MLIRDLLEGIDVSSSGEVLIAGLTFSKDVPMPARGVQRMLSKVEVAGKIVNAMMFGIRGLQLCR